MALKNKLAPSILNADFAKLGEQIAAIEAGGADWVHLDIMDGHFVPNISIGPVVVEAISKVTALPLDCHLMISHPEKYIGEFAAAGATSITVHAEATHHLDSLVRSIKALKISPHKSGLLQNADSQSAPSLTNVKVGVSLNPATPIEALEHILPLLDLVLLMSVNPGFGGQKFIPYTLEKARALRTWADKRGLTLDIQMDGGIGLGNVKEVMASGVNVVVAGTAIFRSTNIPATCAEMKKLMSET